MSVWKNGGYLLIHLGKQYFKFKSKCQLIDVQKCLTKLANNKNECIKGSIHILYALQILYTYLKLVSLLMKDTLRNTCTWNIRISLIWAEWASFTSLQMKLWQESSKKLMYFFLSIYIILIWHFILKHPSYRFVFIGYWIG